ncbi:oxidoreductase [Martelella soudanensis]|uniref:oxidoreductase n=1 Tax=unclassified Martelella TaxID=2629616 RepID=UPI0015DECA3B|nr:MULTISPECIES: NADH:flavin oxidoreductase [unclassified Martelella]
MTHAIYPTLFSPMTIGLREARNRIAQAPMSVCYADENGIPTPAMAEHYGRRAKGGAGMVITENLAISVAGRQMPLQPMLKDDDSLDAFANVAGEIKRHGALAVAQIVHAGRYAGPWSEYEKARRLAPSPVPFELLPGKTVTPAEITEDEIEQALSDFANTARLAEKAGFDGVELHGAQGFLVSSFFSPVMNRRKDGWGGSFENRTRFALEAVRRIRADVGRDFIVGIQLMSDELRPGGWSLDEATSLIPRLEEAGIDFAVPVVSTFETLKTPENAGLFARPTFQHEEVRAIRRFATVPIFTNGGIRDPRVAEDILARGDADGVALARPLFSDPDWPEKVREGRVCELRFCDCTEATCLRTQLTGSRCESWPKAAAEAGYFGYQA